jgi:CRISPR/Cas system-associated protein Cas5 (RAMP superfamily)
MYTIHQQPEAKHTIESLIKIIGSTSQNAQWQTPLKENCTKKKGTKTKRQRRESLLTANTLLYLNFNQDILIS